MLCFLALATPLAAQSVDWIPVNSLPPDERSELLSFSVQLSVGNGALLEQTLSEIGDAAQSADSAYRDAATTLVSDFLRRDQRIIVRPTGQPVRTETKVSALAVLAAIGGSAAFATFSETLEDDPDPTVRVAAALSMVALSIEPQGTLDALSTALGRAVRTGAAGSDEVAPYLALIETVLEDPWVAPGRVLAEGLVAVVNGPYSARIRRSSSTLLELLLER